MWLKLKQLAQGARVWYLQHWSACVCVGGCFRKNTSWTHKCDFFLVLTWQEHITPHTKTLVKGNEHNKPLTTHDEYIVAR